MFLATKTIGILIIQWIMIAHNITGVGTRCGGVGLQERAIGADFKLR